ncbi:hypothetical protein H4Q26_004079 [Puccinia striiformis f. sp. tritici PST-130]|uniref:Uncharacterized protein n=1 Tax=Puccinia striiformis f. sp. tritici PST-78 TaxID=1165861 RepID=A0A0L0VQM6_9BASI|nr:hypothetical protein H4Q26_004079 [Puccinia striiformis f. sp. tritici PST-130]KNF01574.1 hypothetical protein PSTG_05352 [Puccinia striiformis f. sp. tritici PST-78]
MSQRPYGSMSSSNPNRRPNRLTFGISAAAARAVPARDAFLNPLSEPIDVRLTISPFAPVRSTVEGEPDQVPRNVQPLASGFTIAAFEDP